MAAIFLYIFQFLHIFLFANITLVSLIHFLLCKVWLIDWLINLIIWWLQSGKVYLQRCNSSSSSQSSDGSKHQINQTVPKLQDLNFPASSSKPLLNLFDDTNLELKLVSSPTPTNYQSVCTLDKVKFALERAEKEPIKKRSPSYSSSSSSIKDSQNSEGDQDKLFASPVAAGCPGCLSYVLIMKHNPKCPRCNTLVPMPVAKKPRIDLNISIWGKI